MSDLVLFIIGCAVFAIATTGTLMYGYFAFLERSDEDGVRRDVPARVPAQPETIGQR
ncbi:MAG: hypothetical protein R3290_04500 [Acidimicrobiia bacterium]|nr:hypothetical protein [Acidimicrobiia bacterium]